MNHAKQTSKSIRLSRIKHDSFKSYISTTPLALEDYEGYCAPVSQNVPLPEQRLESCRVSSEPPMGSNPGRESRMKILGTAACEYFFVLNAVFFVWKRIAHFEATEGTANMFPAAGIP